MTALRRAAQIAIAFAAIGGAGWAGTAKDTSKMAETEITLSVEWEVDEQWVMGEYTISNPGRDRILIFDRLYHEAKSGARSVDPDYAWRWVGRDDVIVAAKIIPELPRNIDVESPLLPYARLLDPQSEIEGRVVLPIPVNQDLPYTDPRFFTEEARGIRLMISYAVVDGEVPASRVKADEDGVFSVRANWAMPRARTLESKIKPMSLPVLQN